MVSFYEQCFGFAVADSDVSHAELESDAWTLQLVSVPAEVAATINIAVPLRRRVDVPLKLVFRVPELEAAAAKLSRLGGQVDDATPDGASPGSFGAMPSIRRETSSSYSSRAPQRRRPNQLRTPA